MIRYSSIIFIHKIKTKNKPLSITNLYTLNKSKRIAPNTYPLYEPKFKQMQNFIIYKGNYLYNMTPDNIKTNKIKVFKKNLKSYIELTFDPFNLNSKDSLDNDDSNDDISSDSNNY